MNKLSDEKRAMILRALVEGNSMRATARLTGTSKNTVSRLLQAVGSYCQERHDALVRDVESERVQCDEIWSFCGAKERNVPKEEREGRGDVWTWTALCQDTKLMIAYQGPGQGELAGILFDIRSAVEHLHGPLGAVTVQERDGKARVSRSLYVGRRIDGEALPDSVPRDSRLDGPFPDRRGP